MSYFQKGIIAVICILLAVIGVEIVYYQSLSKKVENNNSKLTQNNLLIEPSIVNGEDIGNILTNQLNTSIEQAQDNLLKSSTKEDVYEGKIIEIDKQSGVYKTFTYELALKIQGNKATFFPHFNKRDLSNMNIIQASNNKKISFENLKIGDKVKIVLQTNNLEYFTINTIKISITVL